MQSSQTGFEVDAINGWYLDTDDMLCNFNNPLQGSAVTSGAVGGGLVSPLHPPQEVEMLLCLLNQRGHVQGPIIHTCHLSE